LTPIQQPEVYKINAILRLNTKKVVWLMLTSMVLATTLWAQEVIFQDDFKGRLGPGWSWVREHQKAWRVTEHGLEVRIEPGNMWGPENSARNLLVRAAPDTSGLEIEISVNVENNPTNQYEQVDLVWYYDDSNMVKVGQELVDGKLSVVMGREENDKTRTVAIIPLNSASVQLRMIVKGPRIRGEFKTAGSDDWHQVGECEAPAVPNIKAKISLQFYQGLAEVEHWARVSGFRILKRQERQAGRDAHPPK
jgi:regulation of enolase protein 1 (concanavalin A-like superfamily)